MSSGAQETEIKLAVGEARTARRRLRAAGFRVSRARVFESNTVFDTPKLGLRRASCLLRIREAGGRATLTYKGAPLPGRHKSRQEIELEIARPAAMADIIARLGYVPVFRYQKYRTEYQEARGGGVATVDETPIGVYLELEGSPRWIDRTARRLGFSEDEYITASYGRLYLQWCETRGKRPSHMVFRGR